jgi:murein DD-endopeptidase MepM/ murein hydrolase activator NlpD
VLLALGLIAINYVVFLRDDEDPKAPAIEDKIQDRAAPTDVAPVAPPAAPTRLPDSPLERDNEPAQEGAVLAGALAPGQTVLQALGKRGVEAKILFGMVHEMEKVFDFRRSRVGDQYRLVVDGKGHIARLEYQTSPVDLYVVEKTADGTLTAMKKAVPVQTEVAEVGCLVRSSLYASVQACGEDPALANRLADLFAWDVDFFQDVRDGDQFKFVVEKQFVDGKLYGYGQVLAAEYQGLTGVHRVAWYDNPEAEVSGYFRPDGQASRKEFVKTPLKFSRIAGDYTHHRYNPVLHRYGEHLGVDYAAPEGSPVWAVASGTVEFVGEKGASGNLVAIRHSNGYVSYYAHLASFAKGLEVGSQVHQKQVIGAVGSTGRAGEPHLHFALKHKNRFVDPQKIKFTTDPPIPSELLPHFQTATRGLLERLERAPVRGKRS